MTCALQELDLFLQRPALMETVNPWAGKVGASMVSCSHVLSGSEHCTLWVSERELGKGTQCDTR